MHLLFPKGNQMFCVPVGDAPSIWIGLQLSSQLLIYWQSMKSTNLFLCYRSVQKRQLRWLITEEGLFLRANVWKTVSSHHLIAIIHVRSIITRAINGQVKAILNDLVDAASIDLSFSSISAYASYPHFSNFCIRSDCVIAISSRLTSTGFGL